MDRSFVIEAQRMEGESLKDIVAVVFMNSEPNRAHLGDLGLANIRSISETRPLSKQPTEPTMYAFAPNNGSITVTRFGWDGKLINSDTVHGSPADLIPPVSGQAADSLLYVPSAFVISGSVRDGRQERHVVGVLVCKPEPGKAQIKADKKTLNRLGFHLINSVDAAGTVQGDSNALYIFDRVPAPSSVTVIRLDSSGSRVSEEQVSGEPQQVIPQVRGSAAEKYIYGNGLRPSDFPKRATTAPPPSGETRRRA